MKNRFFSLSLLIFIPAFVFAQITPNLWTAYTANPNAHSNIPNCSYAGYRYGDAPIPTTNATTFNVKDAPFNAKGDGVTDDSESLILALQTAKTAGGGVVYLPDGTYQCSKVLFIGGSNIILRGQSVTGTKIRFTKSLNTAYAQNFTLTPTNTLDQIMWSWCGGMIWITPTSKNTYLSTDPSVNINTTWTGVNAGKIYMAEKEAWNIQNELSAINSNNDRGSFSFTVTDASKLSINQYIAIRYKNTTNWSLMKYIAGDGTWAGTYPWGTGTDWISPLKRPTLDWVTQIESINGNVITLKQPLRIPLRAEWECKVMGIGDIIQESGVENLNIELEKDYVSDYASSSWRTANHNREKGWNGIYLNNAINCFVKDVTIYDAETSAGVAACKNITFTGVKILGKDQTKSVHHGLTCRVQSQDILYENFELNGYGQFDHGINIEDFSMGTAWHNGLVVNGCFDTHRLEPSECIRTNIKVQVAGGYGGAGEAGPQIGARFVHWNVQLKGTNNATIVPAPTMPKGALVGIINAIAASSSSAESVVEAMNQDVTPADLYIAQKKLRNNVIQPESNLTPWPLFTVPSKVEAESSKFSNVGLDNDSQDPMDSSPTKYYNSFMNNTKKAEYDLDIPQNGIYPFNFRVCSSTSGLNTVAIMNLQGDTISTVSFQGKGRGTWESAQTSVPLNTGKTTLVLGMKAGTPCLNWFEIKDPTTIFPISFPTFITKGGKYNAKVKVQLSAAAGVEIRYTIDGSTPETTSLLYDNTVGIILTQSATIKAIGVKLDQKSNEVSANFQIMPALTVPCLVSGLQYSDAFGMVPMSNQASFNDPDTWAEYTVNASESGNYILYDNVSIKLRAPVTSVGFDVAVNGSLIQSLSNLPDMGGNWDRFGAYPIRVNLQEGLNVIRHTATTTRCNLASIELIKDIPTQVPGTIQAEYYLPPTPKIGLLYQNNTGSGKEAGREVDVKTTFTYQYPVDVPVTGIYPVTIFAASRNVVSADLVIQSLGTVVGSYSISTPQTSSDIPILINTDLNLRKGNYILELKVKNGDHRIDKFVVASPTSTNPDDPGIYLYTNLKNIEQLAKIYPNPASNCLKINLQGANAVRIYSIEGILIYQSAFNDETTIDVTRFKQGIYVVRLNNEKAQLIQISR